jgi:hypothetical protein
VREAEAARVAVGREATDVFRLRRRAQATVRRDVPRVEAAFMAARRCAVLEKGTRPERRPDPVGHYPTDPRALPPGWEKAELLTIAHVAEDGRALGGFTWAIWDKR